MGKWYFLIDKGTVQLYDWRLPALRYIFSEPDRSKFKNSGPFVLSFLNLIRLIFQPRHVKHKMLINVVLLLQKLLVSEMCSADAETCCVPCTATPNMNLLSALILMDRYGVNQVPVVMEHIQGQRGQLVGLLDRESIILTCRFCDFFL